MLTRIIVAAVAVGLLAAADEPKKDDPVRADLKKLEGAWKVELVEADGPAPQELKGATLLFAGDKLVMTSNDGQEMKLLVKLDPGKKPKTIDFAADKQVEGGAPGAGIYEVDGDTLKLCIGPPNRRPKEFTGKDDRLLVVLKRKK